MNAKILICGITALLASGLPIVAQAPENDGLLTELQSIELEQQRLEVRRAQILESLQQREAALTAELFALQNQIGAMKQQGDAASLLRLSAVNAPAVKDSDPPPKPTQLENEGISPDTLGDREDKKDKSKREDEDPKGWFLGAGLGTRFNLSGKRVEEVTLSDLADGSLLAQVTKSDQSEIRILFESHYMFDNPSITADGPLGKLEAFASCGIWSFISTITVDETSNKRGCGPFVAVAFDTDASPQEFAIGHMVSFRRANAERPFNFGYGLIIDPDSKTLDKSLFKKDTFIVRDEYAANVRDGTLSLTTEEETVGVVLLFSTNF